MKRCLLYKKDWNEAFKGVDCFLSYIPVPLFTGPPSTDLA